ncbi:MAG: RNA-binding domain-containing protein [Flavobacteriales bacterium]|jgi:predicted HTH transcriptional regulator
MAKESIAIPKYLQQRIAEGEHQTLDFKYAVNDARKIAITLCAFANTDGGTLLIGVKDNGSIAGARLQEEEHMIQAAATMYSKPPIEYSTQGWKAGDRYVLEVIIPSSRYRPHQAVDETGEWKAYLRKHDQNFPAPGVLMQFWKSEHTPMTERYFHTEKEKRLFEALSHKEGYTVSQLSKVSRIPRPIVTTLLARFMRWDLVTLEFDQNIARFRSKE